MHDWPNPTPRAPGRQDWIFGSALALLAAPVVAPFVPMEFANPRLPVIGRQDWVWPSSIALLTAQVAAPFALTDWPNPTLSGVLRTDWIRGTPETLTRPPGSNPTAQYDWPNPRGYPYPELRGICVSSFPPTIPAGATPFSMLDWPNPRGPARGEGTPQGTNPNLFVPPEPPPPTPSGDTNTPGRIEHVPNLTRGRTEDEDAKRARRIREGTIPAPLVPDDGRLQDYERKSAKITQALTRLRDESAELRSEISGLEASQRKRQTARAQKELTLKVQALQLAQVQEAALLEELEVLDVAYVALIALTMTMQ